MAILNYAFTILMSWHLPVDQYGMLGVIQALLLLGGTITGASFPWALTRALAQQPSLAVSAGLFRGALVGNMLLGLGLSGLFWAAGLNGWLGLGPEYQPLMLLAAATVAVLAVGA